MAHPEIDAKRAQLATEGWCLHALPCLAGPAGGRSAGVAMLTQQHINVMDGTDTRYKIQKHVVEGRCMALLASFHDMGPL